MNDYRAFATACIEVLQGWYNWDTGLWNTTGWWNSANALEAVIDYASLNQTDQYNAVIANTFDKNRGSNFQRVYNDDEGWWGLTWLKAYDLTGEKLYLAMAISLFNDMQKSWDERTCGGGVWWKKTREYKNAITNELFLALAARLYLRLGQQAYLDWVNKEAQWLLGSGMINSRYLVNDGLNNACQNNNGTTWTYNQGAILGALVDTARCAGNGSLAGRPAQSYLELAQNIANAAISTLVDNNGILTEPCEVRGNCNQDQTQFKGIFMRNLAYLYQALAGGALPSASYEDYRQFIIANADSIWAKDRTGDNEFGLHWAGPVDATDASRQSSALDAFNAATPFSVAG